MIWFVRRRFARQFYLVETFTYRERLGCPFQGDLELLYSLQTRPHENVKGFQRDLQ